MKYIWERQDVRVGRRVDAHNRSERYIIGYDPRRTGESNAALVSLDDGMMVVSGITWEAMVEHLNDAAMRPVDIRDDDHITGEKS